MPTSTSGVARHSMSELVFQIHNAKIKVSYDRDVEEDKIAISYLEHKSMARLFTKEEIASIPTQIQMPEMKTIKIDAIELTEFQRWVRGVHS
jgi:hypothetical protein